jgi:hypothetical protein
MRERRAQLGEAAMHTSTWTSYEAGDEIGVGALDIERLISAIDRTVDDDFELGEPWNGDPDTLDEDRE